MGSMSGAGGGGLSLLSTGFDMASQVLSGVGQNQQAKYAAKIEELNADQALMAGSYNAGLKKAEISRVKAEQEVAYAANGIEAGSGSDRRVLAATQVAGDMDAAMIQYEAARKAFEHNTQAKLYRKAGKGALVSSLFGAGGSFLSGASALSDRWRAHTYTGAV